MQKQKKNELKIVTIDGRVTEIYGNFLPMLRSPFFRLLLQFPPMQMNTNANMLSGMVTARN